MNSLYPIIPGSSRITRQSSTSTSGPSRRARRTKQHVHARDVPLTLPEDVSMRNLLLANINEQHVLATRLFETLSNSLSGSRRIPRSINPIEEVSEMYARLESLTEEQARLVELARRHQQRWERLQRKRRKRQALDEKARRVLVTLEQGRRELAGIIENGSEVCRGIEMAEKAAIPVDTLVRHATRLAPYTTRPVAAEVAGEALVSTSQSYYPVEPAMMSSKLMRLAKGEVMGPGEVGDGTIVGEGPEEENDPPLPAQQEVVADTTQAAVAPAAKVFKPINLDLSESEDEDDDMEQIA
ncbi:hypothetical protein HD553DRAFT_9146 [Filobasidium floriforme]|uniref:uncharacterized protein n=1 Tax=Filobasidium floriforme TaxID=5210 RepID=UPI001E8D5A5B|nr:uncharacterized protein HD553DRAFT_9146 [Filobasidium floriforme]KAH8090573.1 hypothetical protein HD553DRAFT_9146 [Filobasidium floriforme]